MALHPAIPRSRHLAAALLGMVVLAGDAQAASYPYANDRLPGILDHFEAGLYWLQDLTGTGEPRDPATLLGVMQELAARQFDFGEMALRVSGYRYLRMDLLGRSHFQHRVRDRLFAELAHQLGLHDPGMPRFRILPIVRNAPDRAVAGIWVFRRHHGPQRLDFHLRLGSRKWRIVDVGSNGRLFSDYLRAQRWW